MKPNLTDCSEICIAYVNLNFKHFLFRQIYNIYVIIDFQTYEINLKLFIVNILLILLTQKAKLLLYINIDIYVNYNNDFVFCVKSINKRLL